MNHSSNFLSRPFVVDWTDVSLFDYDWENTNRPSPRSNIGSANLESIEEEPYMERTSTEDLLTYANALDNAIVEATGDEELKIFRGATSLLPSGFRIKLFKQRYESCLEALEGRVDSLVIDIPVKLLDPALLELGIKIKTKIEHEIEEEQKTTNAAFKIDLKEREVEALKTSGEKVTAHQVKRAQNQLKVAKAVKFTQSIYRGYKAKKQARSKALRQSVYTSMKANQDTMAKDVLDKCNRRKGVFLRAACVKGNRTEVQKLHLTTALASLDQKLLAERQGRIKTIIQDEKPKFSELRVDTTSAKATISQEDVVKVASNKSVKAPSVKRGITQEAVAKKLKQMRRKVGINFDTVLLTGKIIKRVLFGLLMLFTLPISISIALCSAFAKMSITEIEARKALEADQKKLPSRVSIL